VSQPVSGSPGPDVSKMRADLEGPIMANAEGLLQEELDKETWILHKDKGGVSLYIREDATTKQVGTKVCCRMEFPAEVVFAKLTSSETDLSGLGNKWELVEDLGDGLRVLWSEIKITLLEDSDFCNGEYLGEYKGALTYSFVAVNHPECPPRRRKIRGKMVTGGWRVTPVNETSCDVTLISVCDMKRYVPKTLAMQGADGSGKTVSNLRKMLREEKKAEAANNNT